MEKTLNVSEEWLKCLLPEAATASRFTGTRGDHGRTTAFERHSKIHLA